MTLQPSIDELSYCQSRMAWNSYVNSVWPQQLWRRDENTRTTWGYTFQLTTEHLSPAQLDPMKHSYDELGEQVLNRLNATPPPLRQGLPHNPSQTASSLKEQLHGTNDTAPPPNRDLYALIQESSQHDPILSQFWDEVNTVPDWVDWSQIARGQDCFYRYGGPMLTGLAFQSLLGGLGAPRVVETLARTGGFSIKVARHRLYETTQHILQCTRSLDALKPGGEGFASSIRVRLLHAAVRQRIMNIAQQRPEYYNIAEWGIPINDLDSIGTIGTFSATLIWVALPRQGIFMRQQEITDYIALWRYIAHLTGTPTEVFSSPDRARKMMEALMLYEIEPSETGRELASNVIGCLEAQPPNYASRDFLTVNARWLNGNALCDALGLERPSWYYWILMAGQCLFFAGLCYTYRTFPLLDRRKVGALKKVFWKVIVESDSVLGKESTFEFKYVPELGKRTRREKKVGESQSEIGHRGVERRNLQALLLGCVIVGMGSYFGMKMGGVVIGKVHRMLSLD